MLASTSCRYIAMGLMAGRGTQPPSRNAMRCIRLAFRCLKSCFPVGSESVLA